MVSQLHLRFSAQRRFSRSLLHSTFFYILHSQKPWQEVKNEALDPVQEAEPDNVAIDEVGKGPDEERRPAVNRLAQPAPPLDYITASGEEIGSGSLLMMDS